MPDQTELHTDRVQRATALGLHGLVVHFDAVRDADWLPWLLEVEEAERGRRSLERRIRNAKLGRFKPLADFQWSWPKAIDRPLLESLFKLRFMDEQANVVLVGPNGSGRRCWRRTWHTRPCWPGTL
jgi:DNA replication protein DnaC